MDITKTQFYSDLIGKSININGSQSSMGYYNLIVSIRDCSLYSKGLKPYRNWKITDVKKYFGLKGNAEQLEAQLRELKERLNA